MAAVALATLLVPVQVAGQLGLPLGEFLPIYLLHTRQGSVLLARLVILVVLGALLAAVGVRRLPARPLLQVPWVCLALALVITVGLLGHAGARLDLMAAHAVHLAGMSAWGGTLLTLAWFPGWRRPKDELQNPGNPPAGKGCMVKPVERLSAMASVVFPAIVIAGIYLGAALGGRWESLLEHSYGR